MRLGRIEPRFVNVVPDVLEDGVVYIAIEYGAVVHACCCGCGEKVTTPLSPAQWTITYNGEELSLQPSVGSGTLPCNSHYFITRNEVRWARPLTPEQTASTLRNDAGVVAQHHAAVSVERPARWRRLKSWFRRERPS